jgi:uncharacterized membrane protein YfcA
MGIFGMLFSVPEAMVLHAISQIAANGSRAWFLRRHLTLTSLIPYCAGAALAVAIASLTEFRPSQKTVFLLLGITPAFLFVRGLTLDYLKKPHAFALGGLVTWLMLAAGASGPLLDLFFQKTRLDRNGVVANKALTQTLGHVLKGSYYSVVFFSAGETPQIPWAISIPLLLILATLGTRLGTWVLERLSEIQFRTWTQRLILAIGALLLTKGLTL